MGWPNRWGWNRHSRKKSSVPVVVRDDSKDSKLESSIPVYPTDAARDRAYELFEGMVIRDIDSFDKAEIDNHLYRLWPWTRELAYPPVQVSVYWRKAAHDVILEVRNGKVFW